MKGIKSKTQTDAPLRPEQVLGSVFRLRRNLAVAIKKRVLPGCGLTTEEADLLVDLYGARYMNWQDPAADADGFVPLVSIKRSLVHNPAALSRRISDLEGAGMIEIRKAEKSESAADKIDRRKIAIRITEKGVGRVKPVYEKYCTLCANLMRNIPMEHQRVLFNSNETLIQILQLAT